MRRRMEALLANQYDPRQDRALEVLESIGTASAHSLLESIANGLRDAPLTVDARVVLDRMRKPR